MQTGRRNEGEDICPFALAVREPAERTRNAGPGTEAVCEGVGIEFSLTQIDVAREPGASAENRAVPAHDFAPVFEQGVIRDFRVLGVERKSGVANGGVPAGKELQDEMEGNSRAGDEFGSRRSMAQFASDGDDGVEDLFFVGSHVNTRVRGGRSDEGSARWLSFWSGVTRAQQDGKCAIDGAFSERTSAAEAGLLVESGHGKRFAEKERYSR